MYLYLLLSKHKAKMFSPRKFYQTFTTSSHFFFYGLPESTEETICPNSLYEFQPSSKNKTKKICYIRVRSCILWNETLRKATESREISGD